MKKSNKPTKAKSTAAKAKAKKRVVAKKAVKAVKSAKVGKAGKAAKVVRKPVGKPGRKNAVTAPDAGSTLDAMNRRQHLRRMMGR